MMAACGAGGGRCHMAPWPPLWAGPARPAASSPREAQRSGPVFQAVTGSRDCSVPCADRPHLARRFQNAGPGAQARLAPTAPCAGKGRPGVRAALAFGAQVQVRGLLLQCPVPHRSSGPLPDPSPPLSPQPRAAPPLALALALPPSCPFYPRLTQGSAARALAQGPPGTGGSSRPGPEAWPQQAWRALPWGGGNRRWSRGCPMPLSWLACPLTAPAGGGQGKGKRESGTGPIRCPGATWPGAGARGGRAVGGDVPRLGPLPRIVREEARWVGVRAVGTAPAPVSRESTSLSRERLTLRLPWGGGGGRTTLQEGLPEHLVEGQRATGVCRLRPGRLSVTGTPGPHPRAADPGLPSPCTGHSALWGFPGTVLPPSLLLPAR